MFFYLIDPVRNWLDDSRVSILSHRTTIQTAKTNGAVSVVKPKHRPTN